MSWIGWALLSAAFAAATALLAKVGVAHVDSNLAMALRTTVVLVFAWGIALALGKPVAAWPQDVLPDGAQRQTWLDWRRSNITTVVKAVSDQVRAIKPKVMLSAAVFCNWIQDRDTVGQDWKLWCDRERVVTAI